MGNRSTSTFDTTRRLEECHHGDQEALAAIVSHLYDDLRRIAHRQLYGCCRGATLDTTALVHETYLKLVGQSRIDCDSRGHFLALVAVAMRQIIIDFARRHRADRRGGDQPRVPLIDDKDRAEGDNVEALIALDQALGRLASFDQRLIKVVECRFFAGFTEEETATALGVSRSTVQREWLRARAWLRSEIGTA
jgi:RNA polymerase sigma factor (TIGR02999 family)